MLTALKRDRSRVTKPQTLEEICQKFGLDEDADGLDPSDQIMLEGMRQHHRHLAEIELEFSEECEHPRSRQIIASEDSTTV